jgi:hypothetical protein
LTFSGQFTDFMRRLVAIPHSEIKAKLDAEKASETAAETSFFPRRQGLEILAFSYLASDLRKGQPQKLLHCHRLRTSIPLANARRK